MDRVGNYYGTTSQGGTANYGAVYKLSRSGSSWVFSPLYNFTGGSDGAYPYGRVVIGPDGSLYGTTRSGGTGSCQFLAATGCGTVFNLKPTPARPVSVLSFWKETVLYRFTGGADGAYPDGDLSFDPSGGIYGTAQDGGYRDNGVVYRLAFASGTWNYTTLYTFTGDSDGRHASGGVIFDNGGNLYGTTTDGGAGAGKVFQLTLSGSTWSENTLHDFLGGSDGTDPEYGALIFDSYGNLYGSTQADGPGGGGTVFELTPAGNNWTYTQVYGFSGGGVGGPLGSLMVDADGNLYGTTSANGGYQNGTAFKLTPSLPGWTQTVLHDFSGGSDGRGPWSNLVFDSNGNLYGTAEVGGANDKGVVFEITP